MSHSKKSSRSKKSDGSNMPNFVFKPGGDTSPSFNYPSSTPASPSVSSAGFAFGSNPSSPASATFSFNTNTPTTTPFVFGDKQSNNFSFDTKSSNPAFGTPAVLKRGVSDLIGTNTAEKGSLRRTNSDLSFGSPSTPQRGGFQFGDSIATQPPSITTPITSTPTTTTTTTTTTTSTFNPPMNTHTTTTTTPTPTTQPVSISFGTPSHTPVSKDGFSFSTPSTGFSSKPPTTTPFTFGSPAKNVSSDVSTTITDKPTTGTFSFGSTDKDDKNKPSVTSSPFTFSNTQSSTTDKLNKDTSIPVVNKPNPFSFTKILEDMGKVTIQPPSLMQASLITPAVSGLQQQSTFHTNFRIDNITPSTRFAELPEQAQKELDELEKYIRGEKQRSEYISNHKMAHHVKQMASAKNTTEQLIQQLDALSSTLQGKMESIETLYNDVKEQSRHASEGGAVMEACKHPGNTNKWLFGYGEQDDYFAVLAKNMTSRLEEYKKCIWEIERTIESWTQNKRQSPQDIAHIMSAQNQTFLALSNKVATLHEKVKVEKQYYAQYLKMYK